MEIPPPSATVAPAAGGAAGGHFKPRLRALLELLGLDVEYERGEGDYLFHRDAAGGEVKVLDLVGGYGSLLLGHAHPVLVAEAQRLLAARRPLHAQGSRRVLAERLAGELARRAGGDFIAVFANSGAEAVEAALKHALLETGGRCFIALGRAFHGKTLGALQLTAHAGHRAPFGRGGLRVLRVPANDTAALEAAFARARGLAGFVFEPVLGEGGIRMLDGGFLQRAAALCAAAGVPMIADECQTGLGRTGSFLACRQLGVMPDYVILSKSLGGGLAKIAALLVDRRRYRPAFDLLHTSTFADDDFSCAIALKVLELAGPELMDRCRDAGRRMLDCLRRLAAAHPGVVAEARGCGLMLALELRRLDRSPALLLRLLSERGELGLAAAGYLLHEHRLRVLPTLGDPFTLRMEPSAGIGAAEEARVMESLDDLCGRLAAADVPRLTRFLWAGGAQRGGAAAETVAAAEPGARCWHAFGGARFRRAQRRAPALRAAWLGHLIDAADLAALDPACAALAEADRTVLLERLAPRLPPVVMGGVDIESLTGARLRFYPIVLPVTSCWFKQRLDERRLELSRALVRQGVEAARSLGCGVVALGQFTSIVTMGGTRVGVDGIGLTTGNSHAIALALEAVAQAVRQAGVAPAESVLVIAGAAGNIGRTCAELLAPAYRRLVLIGSGRPGAWARLRRFAGRFANAVASCDPADLGRGAVVVAALNAVDAPLAPELLGPGAVVCDLSVPAAFAREAAGRRPDVRWIRGGLAALPGGVDLGLPGFPLPPGQAYGCMSEAMLLGFEGVGDARFTGSLTPWHVRRVAELAERHGFGLAGCRHSCVLDGGSRR